MGQFLDWIEHHPGMASWVQAVGSIIALVIAIGVPAWQSANARKSARKEAAERFRAVAQVVQLAFDSIDDIVKALRSADHGKKFFETSSSPNDIRRLIGIMKTIEVKEMATRNAVIAFIAAQRECEHAIAAIENIRSQLSFSTSGPQFSGSNPEAFAKQCAFVIECHKKLLSNLNTLFNEDVVIEKGGEVWSKGIASVQSKAKRGLR
ncbi:hypothetical protein KTD28_00985 [Burkholderia gladioli]|uniref:hypothetical protein n=1 Tax=Burkholderia gladioli TaxID=28095 RepID=UPI00163EAB40|nr:hypothetical protein [Burkholderia gladioli]MBU9153178.1 hypothetical protein [Burkholderia gladioli]